MTTSPLARYLSSFMGTEPLFALPFALAAHFFLLVFPCVFMLAFLDRKTAADVQMRIGPNRSSAWGFWQDFSDFLKTYFKEEILPPLQEAGVHRIGVLLSLGCLALATVYVPFAEAWVVSDAQIGLLVVFIAITSAKLFLFWANHVVVSPWSKISSLRVLNAFGAHALPLVIGLLPIVLASGSLNLAEIVKQQGGMPWNWFILHDPGTLLGSVALFFALLMWQSRMPFDYEKASGEIQQGFQSEYSGARSFQLVWIDQLSSFIVCGLTVSLYLGGWKTPFNLESFGRSACIVEFLFFAVKFFALSFFSLWLRWSLPRATIEQIFRFSWDNMLPIGLLGAFLSLGWAGFVGKSLASLLTGGIS